MKQIIDGRLYDTDKIEFQYDIIDKSGDKYALGKTKRGTWVAISKDKQAILGPKQTRVLLGYQFPDLYVKLFGKAREG